MIDIAIESPLKDDVRALIAALNETLLALTPRGVLLSPDRRADGRTGHDRLCRARERRRGRLRGAETSCRRHRRGQADVHRAGASGRAASADESWREIESLARAEGLRELVLETGDRHPAAWRVYERAGFHRCGPVLDYPDSKWSVFYRKELGMAEASAA